MTGWQVAEDLALAGAAFLAEVAAVVCLAMRLGRSWRRDPGPGTARSGQDMPDADSGS